MSRMKVAVLGAGSWGTALAKLLADEGHRVRLWARREGVEMPIVTEVYRVLYEDEAPLDAVVSLMTRPLEDEWQ